MQLIESKTLGSAQASIEFTNIPQTFTDLLVVASLRDSTSSNALDHWIRFNNNTSNYTWRKLQGSGSAVNSASASVDPYLVFGVGPGATTTTNTFGNFSAYIPNYTANTNKSVSVDAVGENNGTQAFQVISAGLWANSAAIDSIQIIAYSGGQFVQYSMASLYGITKGSDGTTTVS